MMRGKIAPVLSALFPLLCLAGLVVFFDIHQSVREAEKDRESRVPPETVLEFRLLGGARLDETSGKPVYPAALQKLDGKPVVIAGYMTESPGSERPGDYRRFRLVEKAPRMRLRPPAANEGVFVEQRWSTGSGSGEAMAFPGMDGSIAVRGILRLVGFEGENPGLAIGYWFAIEDAILDQLGAP